MKIPASLDLTIDQIEGDLLHLLNEFSEFEEAWRSMINYIHPARGRFIGDAESKKRNLVAKRIQNNAGKEASDVLAAALQSGLTPRNSRWISLKWEEEEPKQIPFLKKWLQDVETIALDELGVSNFYDAMFLYYQDVSVFCNAAVHSGEGMSDSEASLVFDNYAVGEYVFDMSPDGKPDPFIQVRWMKLKTIRETYGTENLPDTLKDKETDDDLKIYYPVVKAVYRKEHRGDPYVSIHYVRGSVSDPNNFVKEDAVLAVRTYESCPNHIGRWNILAGENLAVGPGFDALPHIRRLQEQERTFQMLCHKAADPPVNIPAELKNRANLLPGGENYVRGDRKITTIMERGIQGLNEMLLGIERTEERIGKIFYNEVFLTNSRDPNASPLRTGEVDRRSEEGLIKMGPVVGRIFTQTLLPLIERTINILAKQGKLPEVPEQFQPYVSGFQIRLVSPLAQSMRMLEGRSVQSFLQNLAGAANFYPNVLDKVNADRLIDKFADVTNIPLEILNTEEEVGQIREARAQAQQRERQQQEAVMAQQLQQEQQESQSVVAKNMSQAGAQVSDIAQEGAIGG